MPPRTRVARKAAAPSTDRMTRSKARSETSTRQSISASEAEASPETGAAKPDVKTKVSLAYGSPDRPKAPNRLAPTLRSRAMEGAVGEAVQQSAFVVENKDRESSAGRGRRLSPASSDGSSTTQGERRAPPLTPSFNLERPLAFDAGLDASKPGPQASRLSTKNLRQVDRASTDPSGFVDLLEKMSPQPTQGGDIQGEGELLRPHAEQGRNSSPGSLRSVLLGITLALVAMTFGVMVTLASRDLPLLASPIGSATPAVIGTTPVPDPAELMELRTEIQHLRGRVHSLESSTRLEAAGADDVASKRGINAFAASSGVIVDPYLTSPTRKVPERSRLGPLYRAVLGAPQVRPPTPYSALMPWEDQGDCWCAATSGGSAQLSLVLPRRVAPETLVIEHIPQWATPDPGAAPKNVELWIQVLDPELRELAAARARAELGDLPVLTEDEAASLPSLDKTWIRVASGEYNARAPSSAQAFDVPAMVNLVDLGVFTARMAVRVKGTWGSGDHVCLYRAKMFGQLS